MAAYDPAVVASVLEAQRYALILHRVNAKLISRSTAHELLGYDPSQT